MGVPLIHTHVSQTHRSQARIPPKLERNPNERRHQENGTQFKAATKPQKRFFFLIGSPAPFNSRSDECNVFNRGPDPEKPQKNLCAFAVYPVKSVFASI